MLINNMILYIYYKICAISHVNICSQVSHLVVQERDMASQCLGLLYAVWTGQMTAHWLAVAAPRTSPLGGQWLWLQ